MLIKCLELKGYKRLLLNSIDYIKITPESKIQLILGTNGSGKSSLLSQMSPLPGNPADFNKEGFKIIEVLHNNSHYILKSIFSSSGNKFNFIKDDEELNPGGTTTAFKELVKKEFNIDQDINDLLIGSTKFHSMSVSERRNWFTKLSDSDYTYAIGFYNKLKEQLRDVQGAIKLTQSRLVQESDKLLSEEEEKKYLEDIDELHKFISYLINLKTSNFISKDGLLNQISVIDNKLNSLSLSIKSNKKSFSNIENFKDIDDIDLFLIETQVSIRSSTEKIARLCETIDKEQLTIDAIQKANIDSFDNIDKNIDSYQQELLRLKGLVKLNLVFEDNKQSLNALLAVLPNLTDTFLQMEVNEDRSYSSSNYNLLLEKHKELVYQIDEKDKMLIELIARKRELEHYKQHNKLECPECKHSWYKDYDETSYNKALLGIENVSTFLEKLKKVLTELNTRLESTRIYLELSRVYLNISRSWEILNPLWGYLVNTEAIFKSPRIVPTILEDLKTDLDIYIQMDNIKSKLDECLTLKNMLSKNQDMDITKLTTGLLILNKDLYQTNLLLQRSKNNLIKFNTYKQAITKINEFKLELESLLLTREDKTTSLLDAIKRDALNETIQAMQLELTKKEQVISKISIQKALVSNLNLQVTELTNKLEVLKIMVKELSPTEGLIAKGLTGFINHFVFQMNSFIRQVWLYPLEIIPIMPGDNDDVDLDYKFMVNVNDSNEIPDVGKGSSAIKEITDLAFRVVSMAYLNMLDNPIYIDELGASFDKAHRDTVNQLIRNITTFNNFSQVFLISHYEEVYGSFKNTDITVLCSNNVVLPKDSGFNKHVVITKT